MTIWFLAFLAGASLAICIPAGVRARRNSPFSATQLFKKRMNLIAPRSRNGRWIIIPDNHDVALQRLALRRARKRRRRILALLVVGALASGVWAYLERGSAIEVHLAVDALLVAWIGYMAESRKRRIERAQKVRSLPARRDSAVLEPIEASGGRR